MDTLTTEEKRLEGEGESRTVRTRESDVTRVVHSGLVMRPIYELEARRFRFGEAGGKAWEVLDLCWLAFAILDTISEVTEYQVGASRSEVIKRIRSSARVQAKAAGVDISDEELDEVISRVFDHLSNRERRYLPFEYPYYDGQEGRFDTRKFWLIKAVYTGYGETTSFALTDEGYAAYFGLHETSALDGTAIGNLRIKLFIERGNVDDAILVADQNQKQCFRKAGDIRNVRRAIARNIHAVEFAKINAMADEGTGQAIQIQEESSRLQTLVMAYLQDASDAELEEKLHQLAGQLRHLNSRQMDLVGELQRLPDDYHKHSHKLFRRNSYGILPSPDEVLKRVARLEEHDAARVGREFIARFDPPTRPSLFDPATLMDAMDRFLERMSGPQEKQRAVCEIDGEDLETYHSELTDELMASAGAFMRNAVHKEGFLALSDLMERSCDNGTPMAVAAAMTVFQCFVDPRTAEKNRVQVRLADTESRFSTRLPDGRLYRGHNLALVPLSMGRAEAN
ncbi:hypothetical protein [Desulfoluna spongiiphila]|uniref:hypothetical protein n=1 Tax=Desulfoluna spongiiphila TaxID=419481 RepID=UPI00125874C4|nr:hypothetical protein [Desulfoluna spongiiphila]VVS90898.1 hypothetical protein DBB_4660 [Desulfoluna spongiiphila]